MVLWLHPLLVVWALARESFAPLPPVVLDGDVQPQSSFYSTDTLTAHAGSIHHSEVESEAAAILSCQGCTEATPGQVTKKVSHDNSVAPAGGCATALVGNGLERPCARPQLYTSVLPAHHIS